METGKWLPVISDSATGPKFLQFLLVLAWEKDIASILMVTFSTFHPLVFSRKLCIGEENCPPVVNFYSLLKRLKPEGNAEVKHFCFWSCTSISNQT